MSKKYNWAILGCGKIARQFSHDLQLLPNAKLYAASSRNIERARQFVADFGFEKAYGSYEEMAADPNVDIVYIASPHSFHKEHTLLCLENGKAVLCEKPFAMNSQEVELMIAKAKEKNTFLMEAFWTRFQPSFIKAMEILKSEELGKLKVVRTDFAFNAPKDPNDRFYNLKLGGGSLLDIGIYNIVSALSTLGKPSEIKTMAGFSPNGVEESIQLCFKYPGGEMASLVSSFAAHSSIQSEFWCEQGYLRLNRRWFTPTTISVWKNGDNNETLVKIPESPGYGYQYEAAHVMQCLDNNLKESPVMSFGFSTDLMGILDEVRKDAGISFPNID